MSIGTGFKAAKAAVTSKAGLQVLKLQKHSPSILFVTGTAAVVTSTVMACKATLKLETTLEVHRENINGAHDLHELWRLDKTDVAYNEKTMKRDIAIFKLRETAAVAKLYGPAVLVGGLGICALGGSHVILTKRNAGLMAAYAALEKHFGEYRTRVVAELGEDKERELRFGTEQREIAVDDPETGMTEVKTITTGSQAGLSQYAKLFSKETSPSFDDRGEYNLIFLRAQMSIANDLLNTRGHVTLNDVYDSLGLARTSAGAVTGWVKGNKGDQFIDFGIFDERNEMAFRDFFSGREGAIWLDFNVQGTIWDKI